MATYELNGVNYSGFTCWSCGCVTFVPEHMMTSARGLQRGKQTIYCANGHGNVWTGESEADKLRRERDRLKQENARLEGERRAAEQQQLKAERALKRHKKRAAAGTCPCCKRTFSALAEHMKNKHPEFVKESGANVVPLKAGAA